MLCDPNDWLIQVAHISTSWSPDDVYVYPRHLSPRLSPKIIMSRLEYKKRHRCPKLKRKKKKKKTEVVSWENETVWDKNKSDSARDNEGSPHSKLWPKHMQNNADPNKCVAIDMDQMKIETKHAMSQPGYVRRRKFPVASSSEAAPEKEGVERSVRDRKWRWREQICHLEFYCNWKLPEFWICLMSCNHHTDQGYGQRL